MAAKYTPTGKVIFATLDWNMNDIYGIKVDETPAILFYKKGSSEFTRYRGAFRLKAFEEYINKKLKVKINENEGSEVELDL